MRLLADESVDQPIVEALRNATLDVWAVSEQSPGLTDEDVMDLARREDRLLVTADKDFGELVFRLQLVSHGVILLRLFGVSPEQGASIVTDVFSKYMDDFPGNFVVIDLRGVRVRRPLS
jgi:predicted nuclease of predicted toxin-antitoxin system